MASNKVTETIAIDGVAVAFISGALVAGGAVAAISVWKNEKKTIDQILTAAGAGGAINLGLYLWVPAVFREVWQQRY